MECGLQVPPKVWALLTTCSQPHCTACYAPFPSCEGASSEAIADLRSCQDKVYLHQPEIPEEISFAVDEKPSLLFLFLTFQSHISNRQKLGRASLTFSAAFMKSRIGKCASLNYLLLAVWFVSAAGLTTALCFSPCWLLT